MPKSKLEKHIEEINALEETTSGGAKDAVTFSGTGLSLLKSILFGGNKLSKSRDEEDENDEEDDEMEKSIRNGGDLQEADEDPEDAADTLEEEEYAGKNKINNQIKGRDKAEGATITNKGKRIPKAGSAAVKKHFEFDEDRFTKSFEEEFADVLDATPALDTLAKSYKEVGFAFNEAVSEIAELRRQNVVLAKATGELLKSVAALASDLELIKKQPATTPASGFMVMSKKADGSSEPKRLRKSEIQDTLTDLMNDGNQEAPMLLKRLGVIRSEADLKEFVEDLPTSIREKL